MVDYFLDAVSGNDGNTGLFGSPWKTLDRVNTGISGGAVKRNDVIRLLCGQEYFGSINASALSQAGSGQLTISTWGHGPAPKINGYKISVSGWEAVQAGIWRLNIAANSSQITGNVTGAATDVGHLWGGGFNLYRGVKRDRLEGVYETVNGQQVWRPGLTNEWDFFSDGGFLYVKKVTTPGGDVKIATRQDGVRLGSYMDVTGLHILGHGGHGVLGSDTNQNAITGNIIEAIGGCYIANSTTRYGNGIEAYLGARNWTVTGNHIMQTYDVAFTVQGPMGGSGGARDILFARNYVDHCAQSIEFWAHNATSADFSFRRIRVIENVFAFAGESWSANVRPDADGKGIHILTYDWVGVADILVARNVFYGAVHALAWYRGAFPAGLVVRENSIYLPASRKITWQNNDTMAAPGTNPYVTASKLNVLPDKVEETGEVLAMIAAQAEFATEVARYWRPTAVAA